MYLYSIVLLCILSILISTDLPIVFESAQQTVRVTPSTTAGSTLATVTLLIDTAFLTDENIRNTSSLNIYKNPGVIQHNDNGSIIPRYYSNVRPLFKMVLKNNATISGEYFLQFDSNHLRQLRDTSPVKCIKNDTSYLAISVDLTLLSDSLFHLGDHLIYISTSMNVNNSYYSFSTVVKLKVEAGS